jgi:hypothetical protein
MEIHKDMGNILVMAVVVTIIMAMVVVTVASDGGVEVGWQHCW